MTCGACAVRAGKSLAAVPEVLSADVNFVLKQAKVSAPKGTTSFKKLSTAANEAGFSAHGLIDEKHKAARGELNKTRIKDYLTLALAILLTIPLVAQMGSHFGGAGWQLSGWTQLSLALPVQVVAGARFYVGAWKALRAGAGNMELLVVIGTSAAFGYSLYLLVTQGAAASGQLYFEASAVIITLVLVGKVLEARAVRGATSAIKALMDLRAPVARVKRCDGIAEVPIEQVLQGDIVIVRPGDKVPVDGSVEQGSSEVDESLLTGESSLIEKTIGDFVTGGSVNSNGLLAVRTMRVGADSTLARVIDLVESAQSGKAPVQRLVDKVVTVFVPLVIGIATATFLGWLISGGTYEQGLIAAVSVLVIACPCALGLATPAAIVTGTGAAARAGILIKDVEVLELARRVDTVIFDKTGTLSEGRPAVVDCHVLNANKRHLIGLAAAVQQGSEHPLSGAITRLADVRGVSVATVTNFKSDTGRGVSGIVNGQKILMGNRAFLEQHRVVLTDGVTKADEWQQSSHTVLWMAVDGFLAALFAIIDPVRKESRAAVLELHRLGIQTQVLSGDGQAVTDMVAESVSIKTAYGDTLPADKASAITRLQADNHVVAMIGDGLNDAPALAAADVGVAMGTGTAVAMKASAITLMRPDPRLVPSAFDISRATCRKIKQNLFWAFFYNIFGIPLAALGYLSPAVAGAAMAASSISVVINALLLFRWRPNLH